MVRFVEIVKLVRAFLKKRVQTAVSWQSLIGILVAAEKAVHVACHAFPSRIEEVVVSENRTTKRSDKSIGSPITSTDVVVEEEERYVGGRSQEQGSP